MMTYDESKLVDEIIAENIGKKDNPLNGLTFAQILELAKSRKES